MNTDTPVGITAIELRGVRVDLEAKLTSENGREYLEALKRFLKRQNPWPEAVGIRALDEKRTRECFRGLRYFDRDEKLETLLPPIQPLSFSSQVNPHSLGKVGNLIDMAQTLPGMSDVNAQTAQPAMIEAGRCLTTTQIELLVDLTNAGTIRHLLLTDGWPNLFPVINADGCTVSIVSLTCHNRGPSEMDMVRRWNVKLSEFSSRWTILPRERFFTCTSSHAHL